MRGMIERARRLADARVASVVARTAARARAELPGAGVTERRNGIAVRGRGLHAAREAAGGWAHWREDGR